MLEWTTQGFTQLCFKQSFKANKMKIKWQVKLLWTKNTGKMWYSCVELPSRKETQTRVE